MLLSGLPRPVEILQLQLQLQCRTNSIVLVLDLLVTLAEKCLLSGKINRMTCMVLTSYSYILYSEKFSKS